MHLSTRGSTKLRAFDKGLEEILGGGGQNPVNRKEGVNVAFKELVHKILEKIKDEPYFRYVCVCVCESLFLIFI